MNGEGVCSHVMKFFNSPLCMGGTPRSREKDVWVQGLLAQPSPHVTSLRPYICHGRWASQSLGFRTSTLSRIVTVQSPVFLTHHGHHVVDSDLTEILKDHDACLKGDGTGCPHALAWVFWSHEDGEMHRIG